MPFSDNPTAEQRFTPSIEDIELVEKLLNEQLKNINNGVNQGKNLGPKIHKKLRKYQRQYIGFISEQGERYIYLSCNWQRYNLLDRIRGFSHLMMDGKLNFGLCLMVAVTTGTSRSTLTNRNLLT